MTRYRVQVNDQTYVIDVEDAGQNRYTVKVDNQEFSVHLAEEEGQQPTARVTTTPKAPVVATRPTRGTPTPSDGVRAEIRAPMPGTILDIAVTPGDHVTRGQVLLTLEAMKMKNYIRAPHDGVVDEVSVSPGQQVNHNDTLIRLRES